jgi:hypothetical protein
MKAAPTGDVLLAYARPTFELPPNPDEWSRQTQNRKSIAGPGMGIKVQVNGGDPGHRIKDERCLCRHAEYFLWLH